MLTTEEATAWLKSQEVLRIEKWNKAFPIKQLEQNLAGKISLILENQARFLFEANSHIREYSEFILKLTYNVLLKLKDSIEACPLPAYTYTEDGNLWSRCVDDFILKTKISVDDMLNPKSESIEKYSEMVYQDLIDRGKSKIYIYIPFWLLANDNGHCRFIFRGNFI